MNRITTEHPPENPPAPPEAPPAAPVPPAPPPPTPGLKAGFVRFTERFGHMMSRVLLTLLYITLVAPAGLVISLFGDPLKIRRYRGTSWNPWNPTNEDLDQARRQD